MRDATRRRKRAPVTRSSTRCADRTPGDVPPDFVEALFGGVSAEDLGAVRRPALSPLRRAAPTRICSAPRRRGPEDIRLTDMRAEIGGRDADITVLEVVNDNMPFLLDSTLAELTERGYEPLRGASHPGRGARRRAARLVALRRRGAAAARSRARGARA